MFVLNATYVLQVITWSKVPWNDPYNEKTEPSIEIYWTQLYRSIVLKSTVFSMASKLIFSVAATIIFFGRFSCQWTDKYWSQAL